MIRGLIYWIGGIIFTFIMFIVLLSVQPFISKKSKVPHKLTRFWANFLVKILCGVKYDVEGLENIIPDETYVIVSNHRSFMDILIASAVFPYPFLWLAKDSLFRIPIIGQAMKILGYIPVEREKYISAHRSLMVVKEALEEGSSVWIFPEGTRTPKEVLGRFKRGAFIIAKETNRPLLPVTFYGTDKIFITPLRVRKNRVIVRIEKPIYISDFVADGKEIKEKDIVSALSERVRKILQDTYNHYAGKS